MSKRRLQLAQEQSNWSADGKGHYTSGSATERVADDAHIGGEDLCRFTLVSGSYTVATDGRGTASTVWKLASGGDSHCANFVPGRQFAKGFSINKGLQDAPPAASTSNFLVTPNRTFWVSMSSIGVSTGVCQPPH
jgi:hypothetical protein